MRAFITRILILSCLFTSYLYSNSNDPTDNPQNNEIKSPELNSSITDSIDELSLKSSLVTIEYNYAERAAGATGFIASWNGKNYIFTNIHVLHGAGMSEANQLWVDGPMDPLNGFTRIAHKSRLRTSFQDFQKYLATCPLPKIKSLDGFEIKEN